MVDVGQASLPDVNGEQRLLSLLSCPAELKCQKATVTLILNRKESIVATASRMSKEGPALPATWIVRNTVRVSNICRPADPALLDFPRSA